MKPWLRWSLGLALAAGGAALAWVFYFAGGSGLPGTDLTTPQIEAGDGTVFVIDPTRSTASFELNEVLNGNPNIVVGTTSAVAGQVAVDPLDPTGMRFSQILINARTFQTDSSLRDRQIRGPTILNSARDEFEYITFDVTTFNGPAGPVSVGSIRDLTITGNLTIKGATQPVTFEVTITYVDESTITGTALAMVRRADFGIGIPSVRSVAGVDEEVLISLDFVAVSG